MQIIPCKITQYYIMKDYYLFCFLLLCGQLVSAQTYDLAIAVGNPQAATYLEQGNVIRIGNAYHVATQTIRYDDPYWNWGARIVNHSTNDITSSLNPRLRCRMKIGGLNYIHLDTVFMSVLDTLRGGDSIGLVLHKQLHLDKTAILRRTHFQNPTRCQVQYWIEHDGVESDYSNDTIHYEFIIEPLTNITYPSWSASWRHVSQYLSKARLSPLDGKVQAVATYFPDRRDILGVELGSLYYFPASMHDSLMIDSIDFRYYVDSSYVGDANQEFFVKVSTFEDGNGTGLLDGKIQAEELTLYNILVDSVTGIGTQVSRGAFGLKTIDGADFSDINTQAPPTIFPNGTFCFVSIHIEPSLRRSVSYTLNPSNSLLFGMDSVNYVLNREISSSERPFSAATCLLRDTLYQLTTHSLDKGYWVPSIGLHLGFHAHYMALSTEEKPPATTFNAQLFPNPTSAQLQVRLSANTLPLEVPLQYIITDATGRVLYYTTDYANVSKSPNHRRAVLARRRVLLASKEWAARKVPKPLSSNNSPY